MSALSAEAPKPDTGSVHLYPAGVDVGAAEKKPAAGIHSGSSSGSSFEDTVTAHSSGSRGASISRCQWWAMPPPGEIRCEPFIWCSVTAGAVSSPDEFYRLMFTLKLCALLPPALFSSLFSSVPNDSISHSIPFQKIPFSPKSSS